MSRKWSQRDLRELTAMVAEDRSDIDMARALDRSLKATSMKRLELFGHRPGAQPNAFTSNWTPAFEAPAKRTNDDLSHCLAILRANQGRGFPVAPVPPSYRVAA